MDLVRAKLGAKFVEGGRGSVGYDCAGVILASLSEMGRDLSIPSYSILSRTDPKPHILEHCVEIPSAEHPGDIIVCNRYPVTHLLVYAGEGYAIHCHPRVGKVALTCITNSVYFKPSRCTYYRIKFDG